VNSQKEISATTDRRFGELPSSEAAFAKNEHARPVNPGEVYINHGGCPVKPTTCRLLSDYLQKAAKQRRPQRGSDVALTQLRNPRAPCRQIILDC
jgi:hypothetical protein